MTGLLALLLSIALLVGALASNAWRAGFDRSIGAHRPDLPYLVLIAAPVVAFGTYVVGYRPFATPTGDTSAYIRTYRALEGPWGAFETGRLYYGNSELGFWRVQSLFAGTLSERAWLVVNFAIIVILSAIAYWVLQKSLPAPWLIFPFVFMTYYLVYCGNGMRQSVSIPLAAMGLGLWWRSRRVLAVIVFATAVSMHWSALLLLPIVVVPHFLRSRLVLWATPALSLLAGPALFGLASGLFQTGPLAERVALYGAGVDSSVLSPWTSLNLWLCIATYVGLLLAKREGSDRHAMGIACYLLSLMLATTSINEVWIRTMVVYLFFLPFIMFAVLERTGLRPPVRSALFVLAFTGLLWAWLATSSAQSTLGYLLF